MTDPDQAAFSAGRPLGGAPKGDEVRQAIASLRGYAYQIAVAALAWLDIKDGDRLYLEVAEDYAVVAGNVLNAIQVKDTAASTSLTLNGEGVRQAVSSFVDLVQKNPVSWPFDGSSGRGI